jgi:enoyl-CoA hydratase/carnithine racemase
VARVSDEFTALRVRRDRGVAFVTIDHPPINLFDLTLIQDVIRLGDVLAADDGVRVVVFDSANPDFFIAHADVELIQQLPSPAPPPPTTLGFFHAMVERYRTLPKATIAKIEGRTRGGGSEFVLSLDMRFGALGRAVLAQPEVALGIIPGGGGTQRLPPLVGRARALEIILGCADVPADLAERWGYLNRALPPDDLGPFVENLAFRIASFPAEAIAGAKASIDAAGGDVLPGLLVEADAFNRAAASPEARRRMAAFLAAGGQTPDVERDPADLLQRLETERH